MNNTDVNTIQRSDLNEIETANAYQTLLLECSLTHEDLAARFGKSRSAITNSLRLLKLPKEVQEMVRAGRLAMGHARSLLALPDKAAQKALARRIIDEDLSVREAESETQKMAYLASQEAKIHREHDR